MVERKTSFLYAIFLCFEKHIAKAAKPFFTFDERPFITEGKSYSDSHNYAGVADFVCLGGSPNLQTLVLRRYHGYKEGLTEAQMIQKYRK